MNIHEIVTNYTAQLKDDLNKTDIISKKINVFNQVKISSSGKLDLNIFKKKNVLYFFELAKEEALNTTDICDKISEEKKTNKELKLPKVNDKHVNSYVLYVGKSENYFSNRLKQHLGYGSKSTFALHLIEWERIFGKEIKLVLNYISIDELLTEQSTHLLEIIESSLHHNFKPILGRTGH